MPDLAWNKRWGTQAKQFQEGDPFFNRHKIYGYQWGDPLKSTASFVIPEYIEAYLKPGDIVLEIGPGGGRYSQFMKKSGKIIFVEYNSEFFPILRDMFSNENCDVQCVHTVDCTFSIVPNRIVDFVFSFDCFVHLDIPLIESYLGEIKRVLKQRGTAVIHYADQTKKPAQEKGTDFSPTTPDIMRDLLKKHGFVIKKEDTDRISHSSIVAFGLL